LKKEKEGILKAEEFLDRVKNKDNEITERTAVFCSLLESIRELHRTTDDPVSFISSVLSMTNTVQSVLTQDTKVILPPVNDIDFDLTQLHDLITHNQWLNLENKYQEPVQISKEPEKSDEQEEYDDINFDFELFAPSEKPSKQPPPPLILGENVDFSFDLFDFDGLKEEKKIFKKEPKTSEKKI